MRPVLFTWRGITVRSYTVMLYLGVLAGVFAGALPARARGIAPEAFVVAATVIVAIGLIGGRAWYVVTNWWAYPRKRTWPHIQAGAVLNGGIIAGIGASPVVLLLIGLPFDAFWDAGAIAATLGIGVARLGCLLNGCCSGRATRGRLGLVLPGHDGVWRRRVPTQLMEMLLCLALAGGAAAALPLLPPAGVLLATLGGLGAGRFILEGLRERIGRASRATSAALALFCCVGLAIVLA